MAIPVRAPKSGITKKGEMAIAIFEGTQRVYSTTKEYWRKHFAYTVTVSENDPLYNEIQTWLVATLPHEKHKALAVSSGGFQGSRAVGPDDDPIDRKPKPLRIRFNDAVSRVVNIDKHRIEVSLNKPEQTERRDYGREPSKIEFVASSYAGQQAVIKLLEELNSKQTTSRKAVLKLLNSWGDWTTRSDLPPRTLESVSLPKDQKERIVENLREFLEMEDTYNRLAIPWHRGYMFEGPPGTGKTSLVKALANEFNLDLWYISLSDLKTESSLMEKLIAVGPRSILLLEDIDTIKISHERDEEGTEPGTISLSSLLNTLDGVATPHGLITMMTTNHFDKLDPALTRAGRMDVVEHIDYPTLATISEMFKHFYGSSVKFTSTRTTPTIEGLSTAMVAEIMKRNIKYPSNARNEVQAAINKMR